VRIEDTTWKYKSVTKDCQSIIAIGNQETVLQAGYWRSLWTDFVLFCNGQLGYSLRSNEVPNAVLMSSNLGYARIGFLPRSPFVVNQLSKQRRC